MSGVIQEYRESPNILEDIRTILKKCGIEDSKYSLWGYKEGNLCIDGGYFGFEVYFATGNGNKRDNVCFASYPDAIINLIQRCCVGQNVTKLLKEFAYYWDTEVNYDWSLYIDGWSVIEKVEQILSNCKKSDDIYTKKRKS